jgi:peptidyl-prolyl cis-trans isomerase C
MKQHWIATLTLLASASALAQIPPDTDALLGPGEVAVVNGQRIPESVYRLFTIQGLQANPDELPADARAQIIDRLVNLLLLAQEAENSGLSSERRIAAELALQRLNLLATRMSERYTQQNPPTEEQIEAFYELNLPNLQGTEYKAHHILVETREEAESIIEELDDGEDFAELAREHSLDSTASEGGDLGWLSAQSVLPEIGAAFQSTEPGEYTTTPIQTDFGWHILAIEETRQPPPPAIDEVRDELMQGVASQNLAIRVQQLREEAEVEIVE